MKCICDSGLPQMYRSKKCSGYLKRAVDFMFIERLSLDGTPNAIDLSTTPVPESVLTAMFNDSDIHKRLHIVSNVKNFEQSTQAPKEQDFNDGTSVRLSDGFLQIKFLVPETNVEFIGAIYDLECKNPDMYVRTEDAQLLGYADPATIGQDQKLYPLPVDRIMIVPSPFTTTSEVAMVEVTVNLSISMDYKKWIVLESDEYVFDDTKNYEPQQAYLTQTGTSTSTSAVIVATLAGQGILGNGVPLSGLLSTDFAITGGAAITSIAESPSGTYTLTGTGFAAAQVLTLATSTGYIGSLILS